VKTPDITALFNTFIRPKWEKEMDDWRMAEFRRVNIDLYPDNKHALIKLGWDLETE